MFDRRLLSNFDWVLIIMVLLACLEGVFLIYSASFTHGLPVSNLYLKQLLWVGIGIVGMLLVISIDYHTWGKWAYFLFFLNIIVLLIPLFGGGRVSRWIKFNRFFIQPSEFIKLILILTLGRYFHERKEEEQSLRELIIPGLLTLLPLILIIKQPDLGTAMILLMLFLALLFTAGVRWSYLMALVVSGLLAVPFFWRYLHAYQKKRLLTFLNPEMDPLGAGYHLIQSKIAVGSGGFWGKGFLKGTQNILNFIPAQHTDFIFSVLAEEWGFLGSILTLILFLFILLRGVDIALQAKDRLGVILAVGVLYLLAFHIFVNVGMVTGLLPITGLPFPFLSYGGSSMFATWLGIGILLNVRMRSFN